MTFSYYSNFPMPWLFAIKYRSAFFYFYSWLFYRVIQYLLNGCYVEFFTYQAVYIRERESPLPVKHFFHLSSFSTFLLSAYYSPLGLIIVVSRSFNLHKTPSLYTAFTMWFFSFLFDHVFSCVSPYPTVTALSAIETESKCSSVFTDLRRPRTFIL